MTPATPNRAPPRRMPRTSIIDQRTRARQRLANLATAARRHATGQEAADLDRLERLVRCEAISVPDAQQILTDVIRAQHQREDQAQAA